MRGGNINIIYPEKLAHTENGYLYGLFCGDGYSHHDVKNRHYTVEFYLNSKKDLDIQKKLSQLLIKIGLSPYIQKDPRSNCNRIRVRARRFYEYLNSLKFSKNKFFCLGFVCGLIDSEGYVNKKKSTVFITNTNKNLLNSAKTAFDELNIKTKTIKRVKCRKDKKESFRLFVFMNSIPKLFFSRKISREFR